MKLFKASLVPQSGDRLQGLRDDATESLRGELAGVDLLQGRLVTGTLDANGVLSDGIAFTAATPLNVDHGLGRTARGFLEIPMASQASAPVLAPAYATTTDLTRQLRVVSTNTARCFLWVF